MTERNKIPAARFRVGKMLLRFTVKLLKYATLDSLSLNQDLVH